MADLRQATVFLAALFLILQIGGKNIFSSGSPLGICEMEDSEGPSTELQMCAQTLGCRPCFSAALKSVTMSRGVQVSLPDRDFLSSVYVREAGVIGSYTPLRKLHIDFHYGTSTKSGWRFALCTSTRCLRSFGDSCSRGASDAPDSSDLH